MIKRKSLLIVFLMAIQVIAQESDRTLLKFNSVSVFGGSGFDQRIATSIADFEKLSLNSQLLQSDFSGFESNNYNENFTSYTAIYFNFDIKSKKESPIFNDKILRLGISFHSSNPFSLGYYKEDSFRIDTLTSSSSGKETYLDSIHSENYEFEYTQQSIYLNAAYLVSTNKGSRFSFYTGLEFSLGFSISNSTELIYSEFDFYDGDYGTSNDPFGTDRDFVTESYRNKSGLNFIASLPLGVDFRTGIKRAFWRRFHVLFEYKPGLSVTTIPEIATLSSTFFVASGGLRYEF